MPPVMITAGCRRWLRPLCIWDWLSVFTGQSGTYHSPLRPLHLNAVSNLMTSKNAVGWIRKFWRWVQIEAEKMLRCDNGRRAAALVLAPPQPWQQPPAAAATAFCRRTCVTLQSPNALASGI